MRHFQQKTHTKKKICKSSEINVYHQRTLTCIPAAVFAAVHHLCAMSAKSVIGVFKIYGHYQHL